LSIRFKSLRLVLSVKDLFLLPFFISNSLPAICTKIIKVELDGRIQVIRRRFHL